MKTPLEEILTAGFENDGEGQQDPRGTGRGEDGVRPDAGSTGGSSGRSEFGRGDQRKLPGSGNSGGDQFQGSICP